MRRLIAAADERILPLIVIGGFAGLRHAEIARLEWQDIDLEEGFIEVKAENAKTDTRRIVPLKANLKAFLLPLAKKSGKVISVVNTTKQLLKTATDTADAENQIEGLEWKHNALRHTYISARVAESGDVPRVADEAGNSPQVIRTNYLKRIGRQRRRSGFQFNLNQRCKMIDHILEQASLDVTLLLRESVAGILKEWEQTPGKRKEMSLFLEFNFPFLNLQVQKIMDERNPQSMSASKWLKENPCYPIDAYLYAEIFGWIACGDKNLLSSLFPFTEMTEWFFLHDLTWFSKLLVAVAEAIEKQIKIDPNASMSKLLQSWCLEREKLPVRPTKWLEGTPEGDAKLVEIKNFNNKPENVNPKRLPECAAQENAKRRKIFEKWVSCWQAELRSLDFAIKLRSRGIQNKG